MYLVCPGCEEPFTLRLGIGETKGTRFYFPCPHCDLPIRGFMRGDSIETHELMIDAERYRGEEPPTVVTAHPDVPSRYEADSFTLPSLGAFPAMTLMELGGDRAVEMMEAMGLAAYTAETLWPKVARAFEYYLADNRRLLMATLSQLWGEPPGLKAETAYERAMLANQALVGACQQIVGPVSESEVFSRRLAMKHAAAFRSCWKYVEQARELEDDGTLRDLQRLVIDQLNTFVRHFESWRMGILPRFMDEDARLEADSLRVFRDEFATLRDLYLQGFEVACKTLRFAIAAQNVVKRNDPDDFGPEAPPDVSDRRRNPPKSLRKFDGLSNADKLCYIRAVPGWVKWSEYFDQDIRNTIGHATARHELTTGRIVSDRFPQGITYLDLMGAVFDMFDALSMGAELLRGQRMLGSPDFGDARPGPQGSSSAANPA